MWKPHRPCFLPVLHKEKIENVRFDLFLCEVPVENTANIGPGPINFSVKRQEVDWSRTNIGTNIVTNIGTKLQIGMTGTTLTKN